ncbi:histidine kinase [Isoptericola sp. S6320L]|uniref:sensor histidine kinase n=1 Tax=Isoptericola sp. S6320L TaxID=2926411 RepID=UPI001FF3825B|nr:histidine kinase [Isoptericola sp. S6320L]MCK0115972.1 histidine kinase [Isoptericola sp. S6320L]
MTRRDAAPPPWSDRQWVAPAALAVLLTILLLTSPLRLPLDSYADHQVDGVEVVPSYPLLLATGWWETGLLLPLIAWTAGLSCVLAVLVARQHPSTATLLAAWPFVTVPLIGTFVWGWWLALLMITCLVLQDSWRRAAVPGVATLAAAWLYALSGVPAALPIGPVNAGDVDGGRAVSAGVIYTVAFALVVGGAAVVRLVSASARRDARAAATERRALEVESVAVERARLARDLHDVVAHHVSLVAVRAESAPYTYPDLGEDARRVLGEIADDARSALGELRQVLTVLQRTEGAERAPQPAACDIVELVDQARDAGQDVTLSGDCEDVPDAQGYVLYRAAQEALTNARRHAPGSPTQIAVSHVADVAGLRVTNPVQGQVGQSAGRGLTGMRERVEALGGAMTATVEDSSFVLVITLPTSSGERRGPAVRDVAGAV